MRPTRKNQRSAGFTIIEVMIALAVAGIVMGAMYSLFKYQRDAYEAQSQVTEMQQNLRNALWVMVREIRMAGYDPTFDAGSKIESASKGKMNFTMDITDNAGTGDPDGDTGDANENITYGFTVADDPDEDGVIAGSGAASFVRNGQSIANNIAAVEFYYVLDDGNKVLNPNNFQKEKIEAVEISVLARANRADRNFTNNMTYTTAGGTNWSYGGDNFRRLLLTTTVTCRNF